MWPETWQQLSSCSCRRSARQGYKRHPKLPLRPLVSQRTGKKQFKAGLISLSSVSAAFLSLFRIMSSISMREKLQLVFDSDNISLSSQDSNVGWMFGWNLICIPHCWSQDHRKWTTDKIHTDKSTLQCVLDLVWCILAILKVMYTISLAILWALS